MKPDSTSPNGARETRRTFLKKTAGIAATAATAGILKTPVYGQSQAPSANVIGANNRIVVGYIGTGAQGMNHIRQMKDAADENNIVQAAVCDLYQRRLDQARTTLELSEADAFREHEKLIERKDIDAVVIATVDNWHGPVTIDALEAGKHVFCEKPITRYLGEAFEVYDAVKRTGKVFELGAQGCVDPMFHQAAKWIKEGKLGPLVWGQGSFCRNNRNNSEWTYPMDPAANPENLDWYRWLGRAKRIPFNPYHYFSWHKFYAYNSGLIGNLLPHRFQPMMMATANPEYPRRVTCTGTREISTDREITDTTHLLAEFPSGLTLVVVGSTVNEQGLPDILRGRQATLNFSSGQNQVQLRPERIFSDEIDAEDFSDPARVRNIPRLHTDWLECIRTGRTPAADIELSIRVQTVLCLAEMAERLSMTLLFDPETRRITNGEGKVIPAIDYDTPVPTPQPIPLS